MISGLHNEVIQVSTIHNVLNNYSVFYIQRYLWSVNYFLGYSVEKRSYRLLSI